MKMHRIEINLDELIEEIVERAIDEWERALIKMHSSYRHVLYKKKEVKDFIKSLPKELRGFAEDLLELNISYFLVLRPGTKGAEEVEKHGFTKQQMESLIWLGRLIEDNR